MLKNYFNYPSLQQSHLIKNAVAKHVEAVPQVMSWVKRPKKPKQEPDEKPKHEIPKP